MAFRKGKGTEAIAGGVKNENVVKIGNKIAWTWSINTDEKESKQ